LIWKLKKQFCENLQIIPSTIKFDIKETEYQINDDLIDLAKNKNIRILFIEFQLKKV